MNNDAPTILGFSLDDAIDIVGRHHLSGNINPETRKILTDYAKELNLAGYRLDQYKEHPLGKKRIRPWKIGVVQDTSPYYERTETYVHTDDGWKQKQIIRGFAVHPRQKTLLKDCIDKGLTHDEISQVLDVENDNFMKTLQPQKKSWFSWLW